MRRTMSQESTPPSKDLGAIDTPAPLAEFLVDWAIRDPADIVLDIGTGGGVFLIEAHKRLIGIGVEPDAAGRQLLGVEVDPAALDAFEHQWRSQVGGPLPNVKQADLFDTDLPTVDALVGNPPYVARTRLAQVDAIRRKVFGPEGAGKGFGRLTDLYAYFLVYASRYLRPGGRLAVIVSSSWMDANYGVGLKTFLCNQFALEAILGFEYKIFADASVKPVLLLATKRPNTLAPIDKPVRFIRVKSTFSPRIGWQALNSGGEQLVHPHFVGHTESQSRLDPTLPWGIYLKAPGVYFSLTENPRTSKLAAVATTRIGLQTLAKEFYLLHRKRLDEVGLEPEYREPVAFSPREYSDPVLDESVAPNWFAFYCDKPRDRLLGTHALRHIEWGEQQRMPARDKAIRVVGYHNQPRIQQTKRRPWYNIKAEIDRRGRLPVLIPRRMYENYLVLWNKVGFVPNEDFIEAAPKQQRDLIPLLATLNSSYMEFMFRMHAQVYGGGVFNLNPGPVRRVPTLDIRSLDKTERDSLQEAYAVFIEGCPGAKHVLDDAVLEILGLDEKTRGELLRALEEIRALAPKSKQRPQ